MKSTDILKKILIALKIIEADEIPKKEAKENVVTNEIINNDIIEIKIMKDGKGTLPQEEEEEYYHFAVKDVNDNPIFIEIKTRARRKLDHLLDKKAIKRTKNPLFEYNRYRYYRARGPPC